MCIYKVVGQANKLLNSFCFILCLGKYTFIATWKATFRFGILRLLEVLHRNAEVQGGQPTPGSFVPISSSAVDHTRFHNQACEDTTCTANPIHNH